MPVLLPFQKPADGCMSEKLPRKIFKSTLSFEPIGTIPALKESFLEVVSIKEPKSYRKLLILPIRV